VTRYSVRKRLARAQSRAPIGWMPVLVFAGLCILAALIGPWLDAQISPLLDAWDDAHLDVQHRAAFIAPSCPHPAGPSRGKSNSRKAPRDCHVREFLHQAH
jgi:hypothetical protein